MQLASASGAGLALSGPSWVMAQQIGFDQQRTVSDMLRGLVGANLVREQGVSLSVAALADNGTLVPVTVQVASPMTEQDHVSHIYLLSSRNPVMQVAAFSLGPWSGRAEISTRVRLAGSQQLLALARLSDGQFRYAAAEVIVTESACVDAS
jgi:sulfur-oxidizing protein SoxY